MTEVGLKVETSVERNKVGIVEFIIAGVITVAVLGYLTYALFNPEKF